jgi:HEAT repeat protein
MRLEEFRWTTRAEVCEQLLQFVLQASPGLPPEHDGPFSEPAADRAEELLFFIADDSCAGIIDRLPLPETETTVLERKLQALWRKPEVTAEDLDELTQCPDLGCGEEDGDDFVHLLTRCQTDSTRCAALRLLRTLSPVGRAQVLLSHAHSDPEEQLPPELAEWLYQQWLNHDRLLLEGASDRFGPLNFRVITATRQRPESRALLIEAWGCLDEEQQAKLAGSLTCDIDLTEEFWQWDDEATRQQAVYEAAHDERLLLDCLSTQPAKLGEMAEALSLPFSYLLQHFGENGLLQQIEVKLRAASRALQADIFADVRPGVRRACELLGKWPGESVEARVRSLCLCPDLHRSVSFDLRHVVWDRLWRRARGEALVAAQALSENGERHWAERAVAGMDRHPRPEDRDFLLWASRRRSTRMRYKAIQGLEELGEDSILWRKRLKTLSRSRHPAVRLHATAALVRRGDDSRLPEITRDATTDADVRARAEALRVLGELDAGRHFELFRHALLHDHESFGTFYMPAAEEAALALARLATPDALTALIQAALVGPHIIWASVRFYMMPEECAVFEGPDPGTPMYRYGSWRQGHHWD